MFNEIDVIKIEAWLPGATENDNDGDIYLNRIYRIILSEKTKTIRAVKIKIKNNLNINLITVKKFW